MANAGRHAAYPDAGRFTARVLAAVRRIPPGRVATYGDIASLAGSPRAGRAVGTIMQGCRDAATPCHRVVGAGGSVGGWSGPIGVKMMRLRAEGIRLNSVRIHDFSTVRWLPRGVR